VIIALTSLQPFTITQWLRHSSSGLTEDECKRDTLGSIANDQYLFLGASRTRLVEDRFTRTIDEVAGLLEMSPGDVRE